MGFSVGNFVKSASKSAVDRLVDNVVSSVSVGSPINVKSIASNISQSLLASGSSYASMSSITSLKTDSIISGAASEFFALAGKETGRSLGVSVSDLRRLSTDTLTSHLLNINPETKIAANKAKDQYEVLSVL